MGKESDPLWDLIVMEERDLHIASFNQMSGKKERELKKQLASEERENRINNGRKKYEKGKRKNNHNNNLNADVTFFCYSGV